MRFILIINYLCFLRYNCTITTCIGVNLSCLRIFFLTFSSLLLSQVYPSGKIGLENNHSHSKQGWLGLKGEAFPTALYLGMYTNHWNRGRFGTWNISNNETFGICIKGLMISKSKNSFHDDMYALSIQRNIYKKYFTNSGIVGATLGYRVGLVHGYDSRLIALARYTPVLPFASFLVNLEYGFFGAELAWTGIVLSGLLYFKLIF